MTASIPVVKMSGAGNDFVVLGPEAARLVGDDVAAWARRVCRRGLSVGADGVLLVAPAGNGRVRVRFLNPDGSGAFCGNGSRCAARFAVRSGLAGSPLILETAIGDVPAEVDGNAVILTLPRPEDGGPAVFERGADRVEGRIVSAGVPHFVAFVDDLSAAPLAAWGPWLRAHPRFGVDGTNVDLVRLLGGNSLGIRTWERGVEGETLACGSGALAAAYVALQGRRGPLRVLPASGVPLEVELDEVQGRPIARLSGDARIVFEGLLDPESVSGFDGW